jgi:hypothetical protein
MFFFRACTSLNFATQGLSLGHALLIFTVFVGLWPMHVFGVLDVLLYDELNSLEYILYIQELLRGATHVILGLTCSSAH